MKSIATAIAIALLFTTTIQIVDAKTQRSAAAKRAFRALSPCPSTNQIRGACPGYVVDHIDPLCAGGADHPDNMQWQTVQDAKLKDSLERQQCRAARFINP